MKRLFVLISLLLISTCLWADDYNEFGAFNFLGKMPIVSTKILNKIDCTYLEQTNEKNTEQGNNIFPYILFDFLLHSQFENDCWNQPQVVKDFVNSKIDKYGNIKN